jgi:hypothetical protein
MNVQMCKCGGAACKSAKVKSTCEPPMHPLHQGTENIRRGEITPFTDGLSTDYPSVAPRFPAYPQP